MKYQSNIFYAAEKKYHKSTSDITIFWYHLHFTRMAFNQNPLLPPSQWIRIFLISPQIELNMYKNKLFANMINITNILESLEVVCE